MPPSRPKQIKAVAAELIQARESDDPAVLYLGAGASIASNVQTWEGLASDILDTLAVEWARDAVNTSTGESVSAVEALEEHLSTNPRSADLVTGLIDRALEVARPSMGYQYLARLAAGGFYRVIVTMNWDFLLEECLHQVMQPHELLVLSRDQHSEDYIADALEKQKKRLIVLRLHGDPRGRLRMGDGDSTRDVPDKLRKALARRLHRVHAVGYSGRDTDVMSTLFEKVKDLDMLFVVPHLRGVSSTMRQLASHHVSGEMGIPLQGKDAANPRKVNIGEFDNFYCQLALEIERRILKQPNRQDRLSEIESALLKKEEVGLSYINASQLTAIARRFAREITRDQKPDMVFFVNDPSAPGGMEVKKRVEHDLEAQGIIVAELEIRGEGGNRSFNREFRGEQRVEDSTVRVVHVVDSITFSGNTLNIARDKVRAWYPKAEVRAGALVVSQMLVDSEAGKDEADRIYHDQVTDRFEIFFPWGVTQTTADFDRTFPGVDGDRIVNIVRRPWGAIEVLANQERCSVRLLTIEAHRRLSFQRHLMRDELFVALDDNIGIDLCASDLAPDANQFDPAVKSMVLEKGDYILIPRGVWHRTKASMDRARLLEVGFGLYDQVGDIERLFDDFDRTNADGAK